MIMNAKKMLVAVFTIMMFGIVMAGSASAFDCRSGFACNVGDSGECSFDAKVRSGGPDGAKDSYWNDYNLELQIYPSLYTGYTGDYEAELINTEVSERDVRDNVVRKTVKKYYAIPDSFGSLSDAVRIDVHSELDWDRIGSGQRSAFTESNVRVQYLSFGSASENNFDYAVVPSVDEADEPVDVTDQEVSKSYFAVFDNSLDDDTRLKDFEVTKTGSIFKDRITDPDEFVVVVTYSRSLYNGEDFSIENDVVFRKKDFEMSGDVRIYVNDNLVETFDTEDYIRTRTVSAGVPVRVSRGVWYHPKRNESYSKILREPNIGSELIDKPECDFDYSEIISHNRGEQHCNVTISFESSDDVTVFVDGDNKIWQPFTYPILSPQGLSDDSDGIVYDTGRCADNAFEGKNMITGAVTGDDYNTTSTTMVVYVIAGVLVATALFIIARYFALRSK